MLLLDPVSNARARPAAMSTGWKPDRDGLAFARLMGMKTEEIVAQVKRFRRHHLERGMRSYRWDLTWREWCRTWRQKTEADRRQPHGARVDVDWHAPMTFDEFVHRHGYSDHIASIAEEVGHTEALPEQAWWRFCDKQRKRAPVVGTRWPTIFRVYLQRRVRA